MRLFVIAMLIVAALCFALAAVVSCPSYKPSARNCPLLIALGLLAWVIATVAPLIERAIE